jgi:hypothetical protein
VEGKTIRGSKDSFHQTSPIHLVDAWSVSSDICPGQLKTGDRSNEITAIPELLDFLEMKNVVITIVTRQTVPQKIEDRRNYAGHASGKNRVIGRRVNRANICGVSAAARRYGYHVEKDFLRGVYRSS